VLDETHHLFPTTWDLSNAPLSRDMSGYMFITVHPEHVSKAILSAADLIIAIGRSPGKTLRKFISCAANTHAGFATP